MRKSKGITLIALIITIIVLLILAGVSISILTGENGVIKQAQTAKDKTDLANAQTAIETAVATLQTEYMAELTTNVNKNIEEIFTVGKLNEELVKLNYQLADYSASNSNKSIFGENSLCGSMYKTQVKSVNTSDKNLYNVSIKKKNRKAVEISSSIELANESKASELMRNTMKLANIGDDYDYSVTVGGVTLNEWKVFWVDEEDNGFFIITSDYLPKEVIGVNSDENSISYKTGLIPSSDISNLYDVHWSTSSIPSTLKSVNDDFLNKYHHEYSLNSSKANSICVSTLLNKECWMQFEDIKQGAKYAIGAPTLEMWFKSWNINTKGNTNSATLMCNPEGNSNGYKMKISNPTGNVTTTDNINYEVYLKNTTMNATDGYNNNLYYPHKTRISGCVGYWIASPIAEDYRNICYIGCGGNIDKNYYYRENNFGLRPLVYIK